MKRDHTLFLLELLDEVDYVSTDLFWLLLVEKMSYSFHHHHLFQIRHVSLEPTILYVFLRTGKIIGNVVITHNKFNWYIYL